MITAVFEALLEVLMRAAGWVVGVVRGVFAGSAADAALAASEDKASRRGGRRGGAKEKLRDLAAPGGTEQLVRVYHQLARNDNDRELRIEAIIQIAEHDSAAAEPLLREIIEGPDDPWVVMAALDTAGRHGMTDLLDVVAAAREDPRPVVSALAGPVHKKLCKTKRRASAKGIS